MRIFWLAALSVLLIAGGANGLNIYMVALDGMRAYTGGVPTLHNGGVGGPALWMAGASSTARMGIVIELLNGTYNDNGNVVQNPNQLASATMFFNHVAEGEQGAVDLANIQLSAQNDADEIWHTEAYSTGMIDWVTDIRHGLPDTAISPLIGDYHLMSSDDTASCPHVPGHQTCGGNSFAGRNLWLHTIITIHWRTQTPGGFAYVVFDTGRTEFFTDDDRPYGFQINENNGHGGSTSTTGGYWVPKNGTTVQDAFAVECCVPEPASLLLAIVAAVLIPRRRRGS